MEHLDVTIIGKVQGIGLRYQINEYAEKLGVNGCVRNISDGSVLIEAEGNRPKLDQFLEWLKSSPGRSEIKNLEINRGRVKGYRYFQIY